MNVVRRLTRFQLFVKQHYDCLSNQEKKVADYLLNNQDIIIDCSVSDIAKACNVSPSAVVRFCKNLGFKGLKEFKIVLTSGSLNIKNADTSIIWKDDADTIFHKFFFHSIRALEHSYAATLPVELAQSAVHLAKAVTIDVAGVGGSAILTEYFKQEFMRLGKRVTTYTDSYSMRQMAGLLVDSDVLVAISCSGETSEIIQIVKDSKSRNTFIIAVCSNETSTLVKLADTVIITPAMQVFYNDIHSCSRVAQMAMVSTLYIMTAAAMAKADKNFEENYIERTRYKSLKIQNMQGGYDNVYQHKNDS